MGVRLNFGFSLLISQQLLTRRLLTPTFREISHTFNSCDVLSQWLVIFSQICYCLPLKLWRLRFITKSDALGFRQSENGKQQWRALIKYKPTLEQSGDLSIIFFWCILLISKKIIVNSNSKRILSQIITKWVLVVSESTVLFHALWQFVWIE